MTGPLTTEKFSFADASELVSKTQQSVYVRVKKLGEAAVARVQQTAYLGGAVFVSSVHAYLTVREQQGASIRAGPLPTRKTAPGIVEASCFLRNRWMRLNTLSSIGRCCKWRLHAISS
ncbi:hypothetical protein [Brevibacillus invocatus]|uniref:hypothetical protein n=1 Tax=Brevibacillus invocatus TaxID=173959 RepID=UPI001FE71891|nr:hypothetical protein [Brevibacillus invocatus]